MNEQVIKEQVTREVLELTPDEIITVTGGWTIHTVTGGWWSFWGRDFANWPYIPYVTSPSIYA